MLNLSASLKCDSKEVKELIMMQKFATLTSVLAMSTLLAACGDVDGAPAAGADAEENRNGSLRVYAGPGAAKTSDVALIKYTVTSCAGAEVEFENTAIVPLDKNMVLPGGIGQFEDAPLDNQSAHLFADHFQVLHAGCYDVVAVPLKADQQPSENCLQASASGLNVLEGATTETMLIVQCQTPDPGGLDVVTVVNHEPQITNIVFKTPGEDGELVDGSKFACGFENHVCVIAHDPDKDPMKFELFTSIGGNDGACRVNQLPRGEEATPGEYCFKIECDMGGRVDIKATVFDMLRDESKSLITFEEYFANLGDPKSSRAELAFMSYLGGQADCETPCEPEPEPAPEPEPDCPKKPNKPKKDCE